MTDAVMDCITDGWQRGRTARNLNYTRWEERLTERVDDLRAEYGLAA
jgi:ubiquinone biosynthesis protein Coq4